MVWFMDGAYYTGSAVLDAEPNLSWTLAGVADFNGDGKPDLLWRDSVSGADRIWQMDGTRVSQAAR